MEYASDLRYGVALHRQQDHVSSLTDPAYSLTPHPLEFSALLFCGLPGVDHHSPPLPGYHDITKPARNF
jgi:hypothetical protein